MSYYSDEDILRVCNTTVDKWTTNPHTKEDLAQEVFLRVWKKAQEKDRINIWNCARWALIDVWRKDNGRSWGEVDSNTGLKDGRRTSRHKAIYSSLDKPTNNRHPGQFDSIKFDGYNFQPSENNTSQEATDKVLLQEVKQILDTMSEKEQAAVLHTAKDTTLLEEGERFGVTESRMCQIRTKALSQIRKELGLPQKLFSKGLDPAWGTRALERV